LITAGGSGMGAAAARRLAAVGFKMGVLSSSGKGEALEISDEDWHKGTIARGSALRGVATSTYDKVRHLLQS
jgi:NAD(P)-dependent dehydrogenase (short-subunit alcohol dehydrogenase family)